MRTSFVWLTIIGASLFLQNANAQQKRGTARGNDDPSKMEGARAEVYQEVNGVRLKAYIFEPENAGVSAVKRPAIVFFFGGGWTSGSPTQFEQQCRHFAKRGMVAITADYRVKSRHDVQVVSCVEDAKACIRWVRDNAERLRIDPEKIVAAGGSAGGHLAAATGTLPGFEGKEAKAGASVPNAMVLFNPALVLAPLEGLKIDDFQRRLSPERFGADPKTLSPVHFVKAGTPPAIIFHGKADETVPYETAEAFAAAMKKAGNRCELVGFEGQGHGFFNYARGSRFYGETLKAADAFLVSLGYSTPEK